MTCVICGKEACKTYPLMIERFTAGRDVEHWRRIHDRMNGMAPTVIVVPQAPSPPDPWLPLIRACDDYQPGCCASPAPFCTRFNVVPSRDQCIACLQGQGVSPELQ
jgi:hypothetical protein